MSIEERCLRCILVNKPSYACSSTGPVAPSRCQRCHDLEERGDLSVQTWEEQLPCERKTALTKAFDDPASQLAIQIGPSKWVLQHEDGGLFKLSVSYNRTGRLDRERYAIVDLFYFESRDRGLARSNAPWSCFLDQFDTIGARWVNLYEHVTENVISGAAAYQKEVLTRAQAKDEAESDAAQVILTTLRCLIMCKNLGEFSVRMGIREVLDDDFPGFVCLENPGISETYLGPRLEPLVEIKRLPPSANKDSLREKFDQAVTLSALLNKALSTAQSMLLRGRPQDWPTIFYVQCLLQLIESDLDACSNFTSNFVLILDTLQKAMKTLAKLYLFCCGDSLHPLAEDYDAGWYSFMLGPSTASLYLEHYQERNNDWVMHRDGDDRVNDPAQFLSQLNRYAFGFID